MFALKFIDKTMIKVISSTLIFFGLLMGCSEHSAPKFQAEELAPGGQMTVKELKGLSYIYPGDNISSMEKLNFWSGFSFFRDPWVIAPASTTSRDGLGPLFSTRSCIACHDAGSRGPLSSAGESLPISLVIKFGKKDNYLAQSELSFSDPSYGDQLQPRGLPIKHPVMDKKVVGEASLNLTYSIIEGSFADGTPYQLRKPHYQLTNLAYGELASHIGLTPRFAPNIYGTGLLDAIKQDDLLALEDVDDNDNDGISAKYNRVVDVATQEVKIGRFGLKANHPNLAQQVAAAFRNDIGITNHLFPSESCTAKQLRCKQVATLTTPKASITVTGREHELEINERLFNLVVTFNQLIGVPPARNLQNPITQSGRALFYRVGCSQCHQPSYQTDQAYPIKALANQTIWPYTDLALHDMGEGLADGVIDNKATGREWRTAPLWGIGLQQKNTNRSEFLHDGRARSISEAILWHGGEAKTAQQKYLQLTKVERDALHVFIQSI